MLRGTTISLEDSTDRQRDAAWRRTQLLGLGALLLLFISLVPTGPDYLAALWPELTLLVAIVGTSFWGMSLFGILLGVVAAAGRVMWAVLVMRKSFAQVPR